MGAVAFLVGHEDKEERDDGTEDVDGERSDDAKQVIQGLISKIAILYLQLVLNVTT